MVESGERWMSCHGNERRGNMRFLNCCAWRVACHGRDEGMKRLQQFVHDGFFV